MRTKSKTKCEICGTTKKSTIDYHHIIPRTDPRTNHRLSNLAIICSNCHRRVHAGEIIIEGVFFTSEGSVLFWHNAGDPWFVRPGIMLMKDGTAEIIEEKDEQRYREILEANS